MRKIIEYKSIVKDYDSSLNSEVNRLLSDGWELYGPPTIARSDHHTKIVQAMVRVMEIPEEPNRPERETNHYPEGMFRI